VINILQEISKKVGEMALNPRNFVFIPLKKGAHDTRRDSDYGEA